MAGLSDDPAIRALDAVSKTLLDLASRVVPEGEWDSSRYLPGGDRCIPKLPLIYGTPVLPTSFIPFESEQTLAERDRANRARIAREALRSEPPGDYSPAPSCPSCALGAARRLPPLGFPLVPLPAA